MFHILTALLTCIAGRGPLSELLRVKFVNTPTAAIITLEKTRRNELSKERKVFASPHTTILIYQVFHYSQNSVTNTCEDEVCDRYCEWWIYAAELDLFGPFCGLFNK